MLYFRLLQKDKNNLEALRMLALHSLCRNGDITEVKCSQLLILKMRISRNPRVFMGIYSTMALWKGRGGFKEMFMSPLQSVKLLSNLISSLEILEPQNPELFYRMSLVFTRVVRHISLSMPHSTRPALGSLSLWRPV